MSTNGYPFVSRAQITARIATEPEFAIECVRVIDARHGWMVSHRPAATKLIAKLDAGTVDVVAEAVRLASHYSKTLARIFRERDLAARPDLAAIGVVFGVVPGIAPVAPPEAGAGVAPPPPAAAPVAVLPAAPSDEPAAAPAPAPKRRGRPKGSKNRPKDAPRPARRRTRK